MNTRKLSLVVWCSLAAGCTGALRQALDGGSDSAVDTRQSVDAVGEQSGEDAATGSVRPFSASSPWNTEVSASAALRPDSVELVQHLSGGSPSAQIGVNIHPWSVPLYEVSASTPLVMVRTPLSNLGENQMLMWPVPPGVEPAPAGDGHLLLVDRGRGLAFDFFQARPQQDGSWDCALCATSDLRGDGIRPPQGGNPWWASHGARACGFPLYAGLITVDEIEAGHIDHALVIAYPRLRQGYFVPPASTGHPANGQISQTMGVPCGGRFQLDPALDLNTLGLTPAGLTIARALQQYGAYVGDFSDSISLYADGSPTARSAWTRLGVDQLATTRAIPLNRLRVLDWGTAIRGG